MVKYRLEVPNTPLFDPRKFDALTRNEALKNMTNSITFLQRAIRSKAPIGESGQLVKSIDRTVKWNIGKVYSNLVYAAAMEYGRKAGKGVPNAPKMLIPWLRLSTGGRKYFSFLKARFPKITYNWAAIMLSKKIKEKGIKAKKYFEKGWDISKITINKEWSNFLTMIAKKA